MENIDNFLKRVAEQIFDAHIVAFYEENPLFPINPLYVDKVKIGKAYMKIKKDEHLKKYQGFKKLISPSLSQGSKERQVILDLANKEKVQAQECQNYIDLNFPNKPGKRRRPKKIIDLYLKGLTHEQNTKEKAEKIRHYLGKALEDRIINEIRSEVGIQAEVMRSSNYSKNIKKAIEGINVEDPLKFSFPRFPNSSSQDTEWLRKLRYELRSNL